MKNQRELTTEEFVELTERKIDQLRLTAKLIYVLSLILGISIVVMLLNR
jgi:hypothetical protein